MVFASTKLGGYVRWAMKGKDDAMAATVVSTPPRKSGEHRVTAGEPTSALSLTAGQSIDRFVLESKLGEGGMGVVFIARDPKLQRDIALKVLRPEHDGGTRGQQRMLREAQAMAMLSHPNLITIYEVGTFEGHIFIAMEYVIGCTLNEWLDKSPPLTEIWEVFEQAGNALQAVHDAGLVHRDFKPANVLVTEDRRAKVLDLGIARKLASSEPSEDTERSSADESATGVKSEALIARDTVLSGIAANLGETPSPSGSDDAFAENLTQDGALVGTPDYMAPEQLLSYPVGPQADQFAFAVAFFEALTKQRPYPGKNYFQVMANIVAGTMHPWPPECEAPEKLRTAIERALKNDVDERFESINDLLSACREGIGLRGQLNFLSERWSTNDHGSEYLLSEGSLLDEGLALLQSRPESLPPEHEQFIESSRSAVQRRRMTRRLFAWGLGVTTVGLVPTAWLLERRSQQLGVAQKAQVQATLLAAHEGLTPVLDGAEEDLEMMFDQKGAWFPLVKELMSQGRAGTPEAELQLTQAIQKLNAYFRPVVDNIDSISSLMVASDEGFEYLAFLDPDARSLSPPYHFYNRLVQREHYGQDAFQLFLQEGGDGAPRTSWLKKGGVDGRGNAWQGYRPEERVWFKNAVQSFGSGSIWTDPYLFFITKDAGVTGSIAWKEGVTTYVLAVDYMLTDLSLVTTSLDAPGFVAIVVSRKGECIGLPQDARFKDEASVRAFFANYNKKTAASAQADGKVDSSAQLPQVADVGPAFLAAALRPHDQKHETYSFEFEDQELWAARSPIGAAGLGLTVYVVQKPDSSA